MDNLSTMENAEIAPQVDNSKMEPVCKRDSVSACTVMQALERSRLLIVEQIRRELEWQN